MQEIRINPFERFNSDWALVTAGTPEHYNSMTISWGSMGTIWFLKENDTFTVSFFPAHCREALSKMGTLSGRDCDKIAEAGLTPKPVQGGMTFAEAEQTFVLKKLYMHELDYDSVPEAAKRIYQNGIEPHSLIMGEVTEIL